MARTQDIRTNQEFKEAVEEYSAALFYFSTLSCSVGEALEPKVRELVATQFPRIEFIWIDMNAAPEILGSQNVFVEPTLLLFVEGKEYLRRSRNVHLSEFKEAVQRIYDLAFSD